MSDAGKVNFIVTVGLLVLVVASGLVFHAIEATVHIWDEEYESGFPSLLSMMKTYGFLFLGSVALVVLGNSLERLR
jgi:hypothetical protein